MPKIIDMSPTVNEDRGEWPALKLSDWADTRDTLHMWTQMVGKVRLALAPPVNHWWHVALYTTTAGLTTSPMPANGGTLELSLDFREHVLIFAASDGSRRTIPLRPQTVADFYASFTKVLREMHVDVHIWPMPVEVASPIRFDRDREHKSYDAAAVERWFQVVRQVDIVLKDFRGRFIGKCSPVHFFWGSFDHAVTRFNGKRAPAREGADAITREGYSHEVISAGFWPGSGSVPDAAFYSYAAPEPPGFRDASITPDGASYNAEFSNFILMYDVVRRSPSPRAAALEFLQSTYEAAANLARWNRADLER